MGNYYKNEKRLRYILRNWQQRMDDKRVSDNIELVPLARKMVEDHRRNQQRWSSRNAVLSTIQWTATGLFFSRRIREIISRKSIQETLHCLHSTSQRLQFFTNSNYEIILNLIKYLKDFSLNIKILIFFNCLR